MNQIEDLGLIEISRLFQALSEPTRLQITALLINQGSMSVSMISKELKKSQSLISHHLSCLRNCGVVKYNKKNKMSIMK
jgi:Predicted transcriptional regulators